MHKYIDVSKLRDFSKRKTIDDITDDIVEKYKITNIIDDGGFGEYVFYIANSLYLDYKNEIANYESYIEPSMNARMLMELRRNAVILTDGSLNDFSTEHKALNTIEEVKQHRINFLKRFNDEYIDLNWQYYAFMRYNLGWKFKDFIFDFEECYEDGDWRLQTNQQDYKREFLEAHSYERMIESARNWK